MKKGITLLLAAALTLSVLSGCSGGGSSGAPSGTSSGGSSTESGQSPEGKGTLNLVVTEDIDTLNPHIQRTSDNRMLLQEVGGTLYRIAPAKNGDPYAIIAEMADGDPQKMDEEGLVWNIKVRDDAKWANGETLTAEDYAYSLKMLFDPLLLNAPGTSLEESNIYIKNVTRYFAQAANKETVSWDEVGVKVVEGNTLELTLEKPANAASVKKCFSGTTTMPVYKEYYEGGMNADKTETNYGTTVEKFVSSGPYMMKAWEKGAEYSVVRNPYFPDQEDLSLASIVHKVVPEAGTRLQLFESGKIDWVRLTAADVEQYGDDPRVIKEPTSSTACVGIDVINEKNPILQNQKFRQALYYGTNREEIAKLVNGVPATYFITPQYVADMETGLSFRDTPEAKAYLPENNGYDPEKAKTLFNEALAEAGVDKVTVEMIYHDGVDARKQTSEYLQRAWPELFGTDKLTIKLQAVPSAQLSQKLRDHVTDPNSFELGWIASSYNLLDPASALWEWSKDATRKKIPYYDDEFTAAYNEIIELPLDNTQGRIEKTAAAEKILLDDAPFIPLYQSVFDTLLSERVTLPSKEYNSVLEYGWIWAKVAE